MLKVLIVDDHEAVALGVSFMLSDLLPGCETEMALSLSKTLVFLTEIKYDLLILDVNIPGGNNTDMIRQILAIRPMLKILMFSGYSEESYAVSYIKAGAKGFIEKSVPAREFHKAVTTILAGRVYMSSALKEGLLSDALNNNGHVDLPSMLASLSPRERQVTEFLVSGKGTSEIAHTLNLALPTVSVYRHRIYEKMKVDNVADLIKKVLDIKNLKESE